MNELIQETDKVVSLESWKKYQTKKKSQQSICEYLRILTFHELISESNDILKQLEESPLDYHLAHQSLLILKEFKQRLNIDTPQLSASITV